MKARQPKNVGSAGERTRPTSRLLTFLIAAFVIYLFANQTQVGWLYVMMALLAATLPAAWWFNRRALRGLTAERAVGSAITDELYEGELVRIQLSLSAYKRDLTHLSVVETCPLAAVESPFRETRLFIPEIPKGETARFDYEITLDRRGLHEFAPLALRSRAPFGFFERRGTLAQPTCALVFPEVKKLARLDLLDRRFAPQMTRQRAGTGYEVLGARPYRAGDSPRHIHWRSVARTGQMISKEFADESQPGVTLVFDLFAHPYPDTTSKHTPFEWAVKAGASIADYAARKRYPVYLLADSDVMAYPFGALSQTALLQYLARVQPTGTQSIGDVLNQPTQALVAVLLAWPDRSVVEPLVALRHRGAEVLVALFDPESFPAGGESARTLASELTAIGCDVRLIRYGDELAEILSQDSAMEAVR